MKKLLLAAIHLYQKTKFFHGAVFRAMFMTDRLCKFTPTCSTYTYQAIEKYGTVKGSAMGLKRIIRCHPWSRGGPDPLP